MTDIEAAVQDAFETAGYEVAAVSRNRDRHRVELSEAGADAAALRSLVTEAVDGVVGVDVSTESTAGSDATRTVVSFRRRG